MANQKTKERAAWIISVNSVTNNGNEKGDSHLTLYVDNKWYQFKREDRRNIGKYYIYTSHVEKNRN